MGQLHSKSHLVADVMSETGLNKTQANNAIDAVFASIAEGLKEGKEVRLSGVGTLLTEHKHPSKKYNPSKGESFTYPEHTKVKFRRSKALHHEINPHLSEQ